MSYDMLVRSVEEHSIELAFAPQHDTTENGQS